MKQASNAIANLSDVVVQNQRNLGRAVSSQSTSQASVLSPLQKMRGEPETGPEMALQLSQHIEAFHQPSTRKASLRSVLNMLGQTSVQGLLLHARVQFTQMVEEALASDSLLDLEREVRAMRSEVIARVQQHQPSTEREEKNALQVLLQEQKHTVADLLADRENACSLWDGEMRFYRYHNGQIECQCCGLTTQVNPRSLDEEANRLLVTTDITKAVRRSFFHAMYGGAGVLVVRGVAGTGKTETTKDIANMLGLRCTVCDCHSARFDVTSWHEVMSSGDLIILDEANHLPPDSLKAAIDSATLLGVKLCLTFNPSWHGHSQKVDELLHGCSISVQTELPRYPRILSSMLASEGLQQADDLGERLDGLFTDLRLKCTKQSHYDFGLRKLREVAQQTGAMTRDARVASEMQALTRAVQVSLAAGMSVLDEQAFTSSLIDHCGVDAVQPMHMPTDFWNNAACKLSMSAMARHASMCLSVSPADMSFVSAVVEEEARKAGAEVVAMPGDMSKMTQAELLGRFLDDGSWEDGKLTKALRIAKSKPTWLVAFSSDAFQNPVWEDLHSLLDMNKTLKLPTGEVIRLDAATRLVFAAPSITTATPALISRMSMVNLEPNRRQRL